MYEMTNYPDITNSYSAKELSDISRQPWQWDPALSSEECMMWKMKNKCHVCGIDPKFHRDDCEFSSIQLHWAHTSIERELANARPIPPINDESIDRLIATINELNK